MKKMFVAFLLLCSLQSNAQKDTSSTQFAEPSDSTAIGAPDGKFISKEIGITGGTIISDDGRVELIFPAGALTMTTTISIQPTSNMAPNGVGKAYQFEPSGIQFKKPVQIIFHYTNEEAETCPPDWMSLALQDHKGKWVFFDYEEFDSTKRILKGFIHHFSWASNINDVELKPEKHLIPVGGFTFIDVVDITRDVDLKMATLNQNNTTIWYANGERNGNSKTGKIHGETLPFLEKTKMMTAKYTAPAIMPEINSVAIWAEIYKRTRKGKVLLKRLKTYIDVYDMYKIEITHTRDYRAGMGYKIRDKATFSVTLYPLRAKIGDIQNKVPELVEIGKKIAGCELKILTDGAIGSIHITEDYKKYTLKNYPPEVNLEFSTNKVLLFKFYWDCSRGPNDAPEAIFENHLPNGLSFIANGTAQVYPVKLAGGAQIIIEVTPYRE